MSENGEHWVASETIEMLQRENADLRVEVEHLTRVVAGVRELCIEESTQMPHSESFQDGWHTLATHILKVIKAAKSKVSLHL